MTTWFTAAEPGAAARLVARGATPVGGGTALYSAAFPATLGAEAVLLRWPVPGTPEPGVLPAATTLAALPRADVGQALRDASAATANPGVRRRATVGGWVALRSQTSDSTAPLLALAAVVVLLDPAGVRREVPIDQYLDGAGSGLLISEVHIARWAWPSAYRRIGSASGTGPLHTGVAAVRRPDEGLDLALAGVSLASAGLAPRTVHVPPGGDAPDGLRALAADLPPVTARRVGALGREAVDALT